MDGVEGMSNIPTPDTLHRYWRTNLRWISGLMLVWFVVSFVLVYFARDLNFQFMGWPFSFWVAAQGSLLVYAALVAVYAWAMHLADVAHGVQERED
jgi:putative solute:sodium symporter small subunit